MTTRFWSLLSISLLAALATIAPGNALAGEFPDGYIAKTLAEAVAGKSVDIDGLAEGEFLLAEFLGRQVYIYRRTSTDLARLERQSHSDLIDPTDQRFRGSVRRAFSSTSSTVWARLLLAAEPIAKRSPTRSIDKTILVLAGWAPVSGCAIAITPSAQREAKGFWFRDPCTGTTFDAAGRAFSPPKSANGAPIFNIAVPLYRLERRRVLLGSVDAGSLPALPFSHAELYDNSTPTQRLLGAARYNDIATVRDAIKSGANVKHFRPGEGSPLDAAITGSSTEVVRLLLEHGAIPTSSSEFIAQYLDRQDVLKLLRGAKR